MDSILSLLPELFQAVILRTPEHVRNNLEEIRLRTGCPLELIVSNSCWETPDEDLPIFKKEHAVQMLQRISRYSLYTMEEELKRGYVTIRGGHRIGLAGRVITENGHVLRIRDVTFFNIRLAKQKIGAALPLVPYLYQKGRWLGTLIIGAPQTGKTTLLRDLTRMISGGIPDRCIPAKKTGIIDERSEIAGCVAGVPQNDVGERTDVLDACPKAEGMMMMIRSMSPEVLIVDEIGRKEDMEAMFEALNAGVSVMASAHGFSLTQLKSRPSLAPLLEARMFDRYVILSRANLSMGCRMSVLDKLGRSIAAEEEIWH
ncbi:stage III sporulation protein AA [Sporolactobacillus pectinivorans]|uniref:stage III sporulation protein AA n=1 Tax=Sporolactobacillus pectinivorans TaxID=1591408 RepID=UPI001EFEBFAD|nr:stage III sporulation protein AA [Sporolactobacillus pectinivorans]